MQKGAIGKRATGTRQVNSASDGQIPTTYPTVEYVRRCLSPTSLPLVRTSRSGKSCSRLSHKWMLETNQRLSPSATCCHTTMCTRILLVQFGTLYRTSQILVQPCAICPAGQHQSYLSSTQEQQRRTSECYPRVIQHSDDRHII